MKITNGKIIGAYRALLRLADQPLSLDAAWKMYQLRTALQPHWDFVIGEEQKACRLHGGRIGEGGEISFSSPQEKEAFLRQDRALIRMETEIDRKPVEMDRKDLSDARVSVNDLDALDGLVLWRADDAEKR